MKRGYRRMLAGALAALMLLGISPLNAMAAERRAEEEQLREAIRGDVKWQAQFPNGLFNFIGTRVNVNEGDGSLELSVARQGGTRGEVTVLLKLVDVTAEYGKDYTVRVDNVTQAKGENAIPLIGTLEEGTVNISGEENKPASSVYGVSADTGLTDLSKALEGRTVIEDTPVPKAAEPVSLRQAREEQLGVASGWQSWQELDRQRLNELQSSYDQALDMLPGTEIRLTFAEGEYVKNIYVDLVDDAISETEEQFMLLLQEPTGGAACGDFKTAYVNIQDNDEPEDSVFFFDQSEVVAENGLAQVTVRRTGGLQRYSVVKISTGEGSAQAEADFIPGSQELTFAPGVVSQRVSVTVKENIFRGTERSFELRLTGGEEARVKPGSGACQVVVPPVAEPMTVAEYNAAARAGTLRADPNEVVPVPDKLTPYGEAIAPGVWALGVDDIPLIKEKGMTVINDHSFSYTKACSPGKNAFEVSTPLDFTNIQCIRTSIVEEANTYAGLCRLYLNSKNVAYSFLKTDGRHNVHEYVIEDRYPKTGVNTSLLIQAGLSDGDSKLTVEYIALVAKSLSVSLKEPEQAKIRERFLEKGALVDGKAETFSPGVITIKNVISQVGNDISDPKIKQFQAFPGDKINLNETDDKRNGGLWKFTTLYLYNPWNHKSMRTNSLSLEINDELCDTLGLWDPHSSLEITPEFSYNGQSQFTIQQDTTKPGGIKGLEVDKATFTVDQGDTIYLTADLSTSGAGMTPTWTAEGGIMTATSEGSGVVGAVKFVPTGAKSGVRLDLAYPDFQVMSNPNEYKYLISRPTYTIDGTEYKLDNEDTKAKFQAAMDALFKEDGTPTADPQITLKFDYIFNDHYGENKNPGYTVDDDELISKAKQAFGQPTKAQLRTYYIPAPGAAPMQRDVVNIDAVGNTFQISGKLSQLKWVYGDSATVTVHGTGGLSTREIPLDFLQQNWTAVSISYTDPKDKKTTVFGDLNTVASTNLANPVETYAVQSYPAPGFSTIWSLATRDLNNDGFIDDGEKAFVSARMKALGFDDTNSNFDDEYAYHGNFFAASPKYFSPTKVFYHMVRDEGAAQNRIGVKIIRRDSSLLRPNKFTEDEVKDAVVGILDHQIYYSQGDPAKGIAPMYRDEGNYNTLEHYLARIDLGDFPYTAAVQAGRDNTVILDVSKVMRPKNFRVSQGPDLKNQTDLGLTDTNRDVSLVKTTTVFTYEFDTSAVGVTPTDSEIIFYDSDGNQRGSSVFTGAPTVRTVGNNTIHEFSYTADLFSGLQLQPGDTMSIRGIYQVGDLKRVFPEVRTDVVFHKDPNKLEILASFATPVQPVLKMIGEVGADYELGQKVEDMPHQKMEHQDFTDSNGVQRQLRMLNIGFVQWDSNPPKFMAQQMLTDAKDAAMNQAEAARNKTAAKPDPSASTTQLRESLKKTESATESGATVKDQMNRSQTEGASKRISGKGSVTMGFKVSLAIIMEDGRGSDEIKLEDGTVIHRVNDTHTGTLMFNSLVLTASAYMTSNVDVTFVTPIGIPVIVGVGCSLDAVMAMTMSSHLNDPMNKMYELTGDGTVSLDPANYDYGVKFSIVPALTLSAGVGWKYLNLKVSGTAKFDLFFDLPLYGEKENRKASGKGTVQFSAALKLKVLFIQKSWTIYQSDAIDMFEFKETAAAVLNDPYNDFRYARVTAPTEGDVLARDYKMSPFNTAPTGPDTGVYYGKEVELQTGAYPYPELKAVDLGQGRQLVLFITDDPGRDKYNRSMLVYTVRKDDGTYTEPKPVDNDKTLDESPDAFPVGDKVLITWSDAAREFTAADDEKTTLRQMDISAAWFDPADNSVSAPFAITESTNETMGDKDPHVAVVGDRLIVAYTKTDYDDTTGKSATVEVGDTPAAGTVEVPPKGIGAENETLYGDLINSYSTIAYRIATIGADGTLTWLARNSSGTPGAHELGYDQRILPAVIRVGLWESQLDEADGITTDQVVEPLDKEITDPRILDTALTAYKGEVLVAYVVDEDENLETADQVLYLQRMDLGTETFGHPIRLSSQPGYQSSPKFLHMDGDQLYLYWLSAGNLRYIDMTQILSGGLASETVGSTSVEYLDKAGKPLAGYELTAVAGGEGTVISSFDVAANGEWMVAVWPQSVTVPKESADGKSDPENVDHSSQLFISCTKGPSAKYTGLDAKLQAAASEEEVLALYSSLTGEDYGYDWSVPVRLTPDDKVSYGYPTFTLMNGQMLDMYYVKYTMARNKDKIFVENENDRVLTAACMLVKTEVEATPLTLLLKDVGREVEGVSTNVPYLPMLAGGRSVVTTILTNTGMLPAKGWKCLWKVEYDGKTLESGEREIVHPGTDYLLGGDSMYMDLGFQIPEDFTKPGTVTMTVVDDKGIELQSESYTFAPVETFKIMCSGDFDAKGDVTLDLAFENTGNKPYNGPYTVTMDGKEVASGTLTLDRKESTGKVVTFHPEKLTFGAAREETDGSMTARLTLTVQAGESSKDVILEKTADRFMVEAFRNTLTDTVSVNGTQVANGGSIQLDEDTLGRLAVAYTYAKAPENERVKEVKTVFTSSDPSVAAVASDGAIVPMREGTAVITATTMPVRHEVVAYTDGGFIHHNEDFRTPDELKRSQSFTVTIGSTSDEPDDDDEPSSGGSGSGSSSSSGTGSSSTGTKTETVKNPDGSTTKTTTDAKTGAVTETTKWSDGTTATVKTESSGKTEAQVELSKKTVDAAQESGEAVKLPISALPVKTDKATAAQVTVKTGSDKPISVEVPAKGVTPGTVAILVQPDGTEKVLRTSTSTEKGVVISLADGATVKIVDNGKSFTDVTSKDWFAPCVSFVSGHELFSGTGDGAFSPAVTMDRAMVATILHRMGDEPDAAKATFPDVTDTAYYAKAVSWAAEKGIVTGYDNGAFAPNDPITREQLAVMLYRYAKLSGEGFTGDWMFRMNFTDLDQISDWAYEALCWMTMKGVLQGKDGGRIDPKGQATRAEAAAMLQRFICR